MNETEVAAIARELFACAKGKLVTVRTRCGRSHEGTLHLGDVSLSVIENGFALAVPYTNVDHVEVR